MDSVDTLSAATVEVDGQGVARVTLSAGGPLNIISKATALGVAAILRQLAGRQDVRAVVLAGSGLKTFIGGADIRELAVLTPSSAREFISALSEMCEAARDLPVPVVCAMRGWCIGVGLELAAACDIRIASSDAQFVMPEVKIGIPSVIHGALLSRLVGEGRARWLMLTGESIDAATAERWGLVSQVVPGDELDATVGALAGALAELSPSGMRAQKRVLRTSEEPHLDACIRHSVEIFGAAYESADPGRAMGEFLNRKKTK